jgi:hypothetical protein
MSSENPKYFSAAALSNLAALGAPVAAPLLLDPLVALPFVIAGIILTVSSGGFHAIRNRRWQKLDVLAVMVQIFAVWGGLLAKMHDPVVGMIVFSTCSAAYFPMRKEFDSTSHVIIWILGGLALLTFVAGWEGIAAVGLLLAVAGLSKYVERSRLDVGAHGVIHALGWHLPIMSIPLAVVLIIA